MSPIIQFQVAVNPKVFREILQRAIDNPRTGDAMRSRSAAVLNRVSDGAPDVLIPVAASATDLFKQLNGEAFTSEDDPRLMIDVPVAEVAKHLCGEPELKQQLTASGRETVLMSANLLAPTAGFCK